MNHNQIDQQIDQQDNSLISQHPSEELQLPSQELYEHQRNQKNVVTHISENNNQSQETPYESINEQQYQKEDENSECLIGEIEEVQQEEMKVPEGENTERQNNNQNRPKENQEIEVVEEEDLGNHFKNHSNQYQQKYDSSVSLVLPKVEDRKIDLESELDTKKKNNCTSFKNERMEQEQENCQFNQQNQVYDQDRIGQQTNKKMKRRKQQASDKPPIKKQIYKYKKKNLNQQNQKQKEQKPEGQIIQNIDSPYQVQFEIHSLLNRKSMLDNYNKQSPNILISIILMGQYDNQLTENQWYWIVEDLNNEYNAKKTNWYESFELSQCIKLKKGKFDENQFKQLEKDNQQQKIEYMSFKQICNYQEIEIEFKIQKTELFEDVKYQLQALIDKTEITQERRLQLQRVKNFVEVVKYHKKSNSIKKTINFNQDDIKKLYKQNDSFKSQINNIQQQINSISFFKHVEETKKIAIRQELEKLIQKVQRKAKDE